MTAVPGSLLNEDIATIALAHVLPNPAAPVSTAKRTKLAFYLLTLTAVVFRAEIALVLICHVCYLLLALRIQSPSKFLLGVVIPAALAGGILGLVLTVSVDTFFWRSPTLLWPELAAFLANVFPKDGEGASAWGTSPWHWYITSALPRLLFHPAASTLLVFGFSQKPSAEAMKYLINPNVAYILLYSFLAHKETRFLFPVVPPLTAATAIAAAYISNRRAKSVSFSVATWALILSTLAMFFISHLVVLPLSAANYPGAEALHHLHSLAHNTRPTINVHLDNLSTQTGITRFMYKPVPSKPLITFPGSGDGVMPRIQSGASAWNYDKEENVTALLDPTFWERFDFAIMELPAQAVGSWEVVGTINSLGSPKLLSTRSSRPGKPSTCSAIALIYGRTIAKTWCEVERIAKKSMPLWIDWPLEAKLHILKRGHTPQSSKS